MLPLRPPKEAPPPPMTSSFSEIVLCHGSFPFVTFSKALKTFLRRHFQNLVGGPVFVPFFKKVLFLGNIGRWPNFLDQALVIVAY